MMHNDYQKNINIINNQIIYKTFELYYKSNQIKFNQIKLN